MAASAASGSAGSPLGVGRTAPAFALPDDSGRARRSEEWIGRGDTIIWFTNLCEICAEQAWELSEAIRQGDLAATVVAIHFPGGSEPPPAEFRRQTEAEFPILIDDGSVGRAWAGEAVPDT